MKNLKIAQKLMVAFGLMILLSVGIGVVGLFGLTSMRSEADSMYEHNIKAIEALADIREIFGTQRSDLRAIFLSRNDPAAVSSSIDKINASDKDADEAFTAYLEAIPEGSDLSDFNTARDTWNGPFAEMKVKVFGLVRAGDFDTGYDTFLAAGPSCIGPITTSLASATADSKKQAEGKIGELESNERTILIVLVSIILAGIVIAVWMGVMVSGMISKPLKALTSFMEKAGTTGDISLSPEDERVINHFSQFRDETGRCIKGSSMFVRHVIDAAHELDIVAKGDLTVEIEVESEDDMMGNSLKHMVDKLRNVIGEIYNSTDQVADGSKQIADGAQSLAQGSTQQAAAVEQLSSSISEIADKTHDNAVKAEKAADLARSIKTSAEKGEKQMDEMIGAVKDINAASQSISKVIKVIDDIAFQTNILALNAAVEAARAGQHGKGFAVVAEEVRNLASKSAEAAKDTGTLIANSMEKAELGSRIAHDTADSLNEIVSGINESAQIITDIAESSEEQSLGIKQINKGIDQVAQVVQQNSATAEESAAASEEMSGQANLLGELVHQFKLKDSGAKRLPPPSGAPRNISMPPPGQTRTVYKPTGGADYGKY